LGLCRIAAHALGIGAEQFVREGVEAEIEKREKLPDANAGGILRNAVQRGDHFQIFQPAERFKYRAGFGHKTDVAFHLNGLGFQVETANGSGAGAGLDHAGEHFQGGGFAGAVRPEKADDLSSGNFEGERVDGDLLTVAFGQLFQRNHELNVLFTGFPALGTVVLNFSQGNEERVP